MRFNRAAKVAALPLLAMVLVVALVACQGPIGPKGDKGDTVTGGAGTAGKDAPAPLQALAVDPVVFDVAMADMDMVMLSDAFTGGNPVGRTFTILAMDGDWLTATLGTGENAGMLMLSVAETVVPQAEDAVVQVSAVDVATGDGPRAAAVAFISVRANDPVMTEGTTQNGLTVGTKAVASRTLTEATEADYHNEDTIKCAMMNSCEVTLTAEDENVRDVLEWMVYVTATGVDTGDTPDIADANNDIVLAAVTNGVAQLDGVVTIKGLKTGTATVRVWAVDEGRMPKNIADVEATPANESRPWPAMVHTITVTVDGEPRLSADALEDIRFTSLTGAAATMVIGTVFNDETGEVLMLTSTVAHPTVASVAWSGDNAVDRADTDGAGLPIAVTGKNSELTGTAITVKVTEAVLPNNPSQFTEHDFKVIVDL